VDWDYPAFHLHMHCYLCTLLGGSLHLNEHEAARWLGAGDLHGVRWLPADDQILPLIRQELCQTDTDSAGVRSRSDRKRCEQ